MERDLRNHDLYREAEALFTALRRPGTGQLSDASDIHATPDAVVFSGVMFDRLEGEPQTRVCMTTLATGETRVLTFGPNTDRAARFSPDGRQIAFVSDRHRQGDFQLYLLDPSSGAATRTPPVEGWIEYLRWSPDGARVLLGVAGYGADVAAAQGAITSKQHAQTDSWLPSVETGDESYRWRRLWIYDLATATVAQVSPNTINVWEAAWCGDGALAAIASAAPAEGCWYSASLWKIELVTGHCERIYTPRDQLGVPAGAPSGQHLGVVEAVCSDRGFVAGDLKLLDIASGKIRRADTHGVDISHIEWRSDQHLLLAGHRGLETVVGIYEVSSDSFRETWASSEISTVGRFAAVTGLGASGDCALLGEGFARAPEIAVIRSGQYRSVRSFDLGHRVGISVEAHTWNAPDGLELQGWLLRPEGNGVAPLILHVHGGPVWHWRSTWLGRNGGVILLLLNRGYSVFWPNPRGSTGRGLEFARRVQGDMGGGETQDHLSGLDHLVARGLADPKRLGVMGGSHGGFMTSWLITQDTRFAAAVSVAPVTNYVTQHLISNIPQFVELFVGDKYTQPDGRYFGRSPVMHVHRARTPTLNICGALDRCTPPEEAVQFHNALVEHGIESVLVMYPEEGHGVRRYPAVIDYTARVMAWFEKHMRMSR